MSFEASLCLRHGHRKFTIAAAEQTQFLSPFGRRGSCARRYRREGTDDGDHSIQNTTHNTSNTELTFSALPIHQSQQRSSAREQGRAPSAKESDCFPDVSREMGVDAFVSLRSINSRSRNTRIPMRPSVHSHKLAYSKKCRLEERRDWVGAPMRTLNSAAAERVQRVQVGGLFDRGKRSEGENWSL